MSLTAETLPAQFQQPDGWEWGWFDGAHEGRLRYGHVQAQDAVAEIVVLPGLSEFGEKYYELAHDFLPERLNFWILDWQGQGRSSRGLPDDRHRRISHGFEHDLSDLNTWLENHVIPNTGGRPLILLGHSMGGHFALRYLHDHPERFRFAVICSPMIAIEGLKFFPDFSLPPLLNVLASITPHSYIPGGSSYDPQLRYKLGEKTFSHDMVRNKVHHAWTDYDEELQVGSVTFSWLHHAESSGRILRQEEFLQAISTPCLLFTGDEEKIVSNPEIVRASEVLPNCEFEMLSPAGHELLMETDSVRERVLRRLREWVRIHIP